MSDRYECEDCGKPWNSLSAVMQCPCDRYDQYGYERRATPSPQKG